MRRSAKVSSEQQSHIKVAASCVRSMLLLTGALAGCGEFEQYRVMPSPEGVVATIGVPPSGDAYTVCFAERPLPTCPRSRAAIYSYRAKASERWWEGRDTFVVLQLGGEMRTLVENPIRVGNKEVRIRYQACRREPYWADNERRC